MENATNKQFFEKCYVPDCPNAATKKIGSLLLCEECNLETENEPSAVLDYERGL